MSDQKKGEPKGDESRGRPDNRREKTEAVLEDGVPEDERRKPHSGDVKQER